MADSDIREAFERCTGIRISNAILIETALTHSSCAFEKQRPELSNERLEFLGDAVLELIASEYLFSQPEAMSEGEMTRRRAAAVCERSLVKAAKLAGIDELIRLGRGEENSGGRKRASILSDAFEAVIGALYLDQGFDVARKFVIRHLADVLQDSEAVRDYKSELQEYVQNGLGLTSYSINYTVASAEGPDHDRIYNIVLLVDGKLAGTGKGRSKKKAEQQAACTALAQLTHSGQTMQK